MVALELFLFQVRRHSSSKSLSQLSLLLRTPSPHPTPNSPFLEFHRSLCSSSSSAPQPDEDGSHEPTAPIHEYEFSKPKDQSSPTNTNAETRAWTREDIRYVKDVPKISPVSYPSRVAPLPEDRASTAEAKVEEEEKKNQEMDEQLQRETRRIREDNRRIRWGGGLRVEEEILPFPTLIKLEQQEQKKNKVVYDLHEAIRLVKTNAKANFNETVEVHVNLAAELRRTDLKIDGIATLPHATGKAVKIAVFADGSAADEAKAAGADIVGGVELVEGVQNGNVKADFDICITTHQFVPRLQKLGKVLKGRMPSTKAGTVTEDVAKVVREAKRIVKFNKKDKAAVVHVGIGKVSFSEDALRENIGAFVNALLLAKPAGLKKSSKYAGYMNSVHICSTMGPGYPVSIQSLSMAVDRYNRLRLI